MFLPKEQFLVWCAGFFDGEGCISIRHNSRGHSSLQVDLTQCVREILDQVQAEFGGTVHTRKSVNPKWRTAYNLTFQAKTAKYFLEAIYPYLYIKKKQARLALEFYTTVGLSATKRLPANIIKLRGDIKAQISLLNHAKKFEPYDKVIGD